MKNIACFVFFCYNKLKTNNKYKKLKTNNNYKKGEKNLNKKQLLKKEKFNKNLHIKVKLYMAFIVLVGICILNQFALFLATKDILKLVSILMIFCTNMPLLVSQKILNNLKIKGNVLFAIQIAGLAGLTVIALH